MSGENWLFQVDQLISQGRADEAQDLLIQIVKSEPENTQAWLLLADSIPAPEEQLQVLEEALRHNPGNSEIQQMKDRLSQGDHPGPKVDAWTPPLEPENAGPASNLGAFEFSEEEWKTFKADAESDPAPKDESFQPPNLLNDEVDEKQWLESLRTATWNAGAVEETPVQPGADLPAPGSAFSWQVESDAGSDEISPELADLAWQPPESTPSAFSSPQVEIFGSRPKPGGEAEKPAAESVFVPRPPQAAPAGPALVGEMPEPKETTSREELLGDLDIQDLEEPAPRRLWLIFVIGVLILGAVAGGLFLAWPSISALIPQNLFAPAAEVPTETPLSAADLPTATLKPSPVPTITPTPTRTLTPTPVPPSATPAPLSPVVYAVPISVSNIQQFKLLAQEKGHYEFSNDVKVGATASDSLTVRVWDVARNGIRMELKGPRAPIQSVAVSPDGKWVAAACEEPAVYVWNAETGVAAGTFEFSKDLVEYYKDKTFSHTLQLKFGPEGKTLAVGSLLGLTWWDLDTKKEHHLYPLTVAELVTFRDQAQSAKNGRATSFLLAFSPDGKSLAIGSPFKVYLLFWPSGNPWTSLATGKPLLDLDYFASNMLALAHPGTLSIWETISSRQILSFPGLKSLQAQEVPPGAAFRADGKMIAVESENARGQPGAFKLVDLPSGKFGLTLDANTTNPVETAIFSADGKLVMARSGGDLFVWDVATGKELRRIANRKGFSQILNDGKIYVEYSAVDTLLWGGLP